MPLFSFSKKTTNRSYLLIDISSSSVGAALSHVRSGERTTIHYSIREPIIPRDTEEVTDAMLRALDTVCEGVVQRGSPVLRRDTGSGHVDAVHVSVAAPWQQTRVLTESVTKDKPFTFTRVLLDEVVGRAISAEGGRRESGRSVIATLLNGYEVQDPFGKRAKRADLVILSSTITEDVAESIERSIRRHFHRNMELTAFAPATYAVFRDLFPHEKDFLILSVSGEGSDLIFVKHSLLVSVEMMPIGLNSLLHAAQSATSKVDINRLTHFVVDPVRNQRFATNLSSIEEAWLAELSKALGGFAARHPLPRTLFVIADPHARSYLARLLDRTSLRSLWLADAPLAIIPVEPKHLSQHVRVRVEAEADTALSLLALYAAKSHKG